MDPPRPDHDGAADGETAPATPDTTAPTLARTVPALLVFLGATFVGAIATAPLQDFLSPTVSLLAAALIGEGLGIVLAVGIAGWPWKSIVTSLGFSRATVRPLLMIGFGNLIFDTALLIVISLLGAKPETAFADLLDTNDLRELAFAFVAIAIAVPVIEELLVRGLILRMLLYRWGRTAAVLGSAAIFAILHWSWQAPFAFLSGVWWAIAFLTTGSFGAPIALHMLQNAAAFLVFQLARLVGGEDPSDVAPPLAAGLGLAAIVAALGASMIIRGLRRLPRHPERVAAVLALPADAAFSGADRSESTRSTAS